MKQNYWKMACMTAVGTLLLTAGVQSVSAVGATDIMKAQQAVKVVGTVTDGTEPIITYIGYKEVTVKAQNGMKVVMQEERTTPPVS